MKKLKLCGVWTLFTALIIRILSVENKFYMLKKLSHHRSKIAIQLFTILAQYQLLSYWGGTVLIILKRYGCKKMSSSQYEFATFLAGGKTY